MKITFLGTGSSTGIPILGCRCRVCASKKPKNKRHRPSLLLSYHGKQVLIDAPPELRIQLLRERIMRIDALLFTHCHADHVYGMDDIRVFTRQCRVPVFGTKATLGEIKSIFPYVFKKTQKGGGKPRLRMRAIAGTFRVFGKTILAFPVFHGARLASGFRVDHLAYIPDYSRIPPATFKCLRGLDVLILDALRDTPHSTHVTLAESVAVAERIGASRTYFTHIAHNLEHDASERKLPRGMKMAYDGLKISI
jgi:phosphoribosyl 1,2-cyclic phosphate phosphodiesterase